MYLRAAFYGCHGPRIGRKPHSQAKAFVVLNVTRLAPRRTQHGQHALDVWAGLASFFTLCGQTHASLHLGLSTRRSQITGNVCPCSRDLDCLYGMGRESFGGIQTTTRPRSGLGWMGC